MELGKMGHHTGFGMGHLERLKNRASFLLKDSLKIARVALVDVSTAELTTEEATNADEWGPTTKQMAEISNSSNNSEDYLRIVRILHERFALNTKKYWRQIHKSLILLEYLLCHGPEHLVMEFRQDKGRFEEFARIVYVDWKGVDRGSVLQRRAKHVLNLLTDEAFYVRERTSAQKISKGISGFGSESLPHMYTGSKSLDSPIPRSQSASVLVGIHHYSGDEDSSTLLADEDGRFNSEPDTPSSRGRSSSSGAFSSSSGSGCSTNSTCSGGNPSEGDSSPTSSTLSSNKTSQILDMDSVASEVEGLAVVENISPPLLQKLPPPPPRAGFKSAMPLSRKNGSGVRQKQTQSRVSAVPDLITI